MKDSNRYMGVNFSKSSFADVIRPNDYLMFCNLQNTSFEGLDLSYVRFIGCYLNGTSFQRSTLYHTEFTGCFSYHNASPTDFRRCIWSDVTVIDSQINYLSDSLLLQQHNWPSKVAEYTLETLSERNDVRYSAVAKLGDLDNPVVSLVLGYLLADPEWDVRSITLKSLGLLRHEQFPHYDRELLGWMFLLLGDENSLVRQTSESLVQMILPADDILLPAIQQIKANTENVQLKGLRAAIQLCRSNDYKHLIDFETLERLTVSQSSDVRSETLHLLGILDYPESMELILQHLSDPEPSVRIAGLYAITLLTHPPSLKVLAQLLHDPDEQVRIEVLYTFGRIGDFDRQDVEIALSDPLEEVRTVARELLALS